jgi:hypothetical protein
VIFTLPALASQDRNFGLGGMTSGRVSGVTAETENPFAALYNPALIPSQSRAQFGFSTGLAGSRHGTLTQVLVDSPQYRTERGIARRQDLKLQDFSAAQWTTGLTLPFRLPFLKPRRGGLGLAVSGPYERLRSFHAGTPYDFSRLRYGTSDAQFKGTIGGGVEILPETLFFGGGLSLFMTTAGAADATLVADNPTGRLQLDVGLNTALVAGLYGRHEMTSAALVYRQEVNPTLDQKFEGQVQLGGTETFHQPFVMHASMYFEPAALEMDVQHDFGPVKASAGLSYQRWTTYHPSYLVLSGPDAGGATRTTRAPRPPMRDTFSPRTSLEVPFLERRMSVAAGYQYRPTPMTDLSGPVNVLDSDTHIVGLSLRHRLGESEWFPFPMSWGIYGQYHWIANRRVEKADPGYIGAPGFDFGGNAYAYGLSLQAEL